MPTWLGGVYASNRQCQRHRMKGRRKTTLRFHEILDVLTFSIHPKKLASLSTHSVFSTFSVGTCPVVFIGYSLSRIHDITSKFPFFFRGQKSGVNSAAGWVCEVSVTRDSWQLTRYFGNHLQGPKASK